MLTLHVEAPTLRTLIDKVADEIGLMVTMPDAAFPTTTNAPATAPASVDPPKPEPPGEPPVMTPPTVDIRRKPGRPPKAAPVASAPASTVAVAPAPPVMVAPEEQALVTTKEQVKAAFHKLAERRADETNEVGGLNRVYAIVNQFARADGEACRKLGEIQPHDYPAVLAATEQAISAGVSG